MSNVSLKPNALCLLLSLAFRPQRDMKIYGLFDVDALTDDIIVCAP